MAKFLIVSGNFYRDLADELLKGAKAALETSGHEAEAVEVPGALEIPQAIRYGIESGNYAGYIALGTVIRGETAHYDVVAGESSRALMDMALEHQAPMGNGILTVETRDQAWTRANIHEKNKGADAANAAISLYELKSKI
ncbi:MAG: 6,7-dimethyl-8-ribityllumazine synthase [Rickettsiales bacterium]|nr:6,7-dimethyl-8-ribityllumazine synthase [Rickettsiales bacterium]